MASLFCAVILITYTIFFCKLLNGKEYYQKGKGKRRVGREGRERRERREGREVMRGR